MELADLSHRLFVEVPISLYQSMSYYYRSGTLVPGVVSGTLDRDFIFTTVTGVSGTENTLGRYNYQWILIKAV